MYLLRCLTVGSAALGLAVAQGPNAGEADDNGYVDPNAYYHEADVIASMRNCTENLHVCPDSCYFHGTCNADGSCTCETGRTGSACEEQTCDSCGPHGICEEDGSCTCKPGYGGEGCFDLVCLDEVQACCDIDGNCGCKNQEDQSLCTQRPDLTINEDNFETRLDLEWFEDCDCAVDEGCALPGLRLLLRFPTETYNIGDADIFVGEPGNVLKHWDWHVCHNHAHFRDFAKFWLIDNDSGAHGDGQKSGFCMVDSVMRVEGSNPVRVHNCRTAQGIQAGWADVYGSSLDCQWIDVTDIPVNKSYTLAAHVNPENKIFEANYDNNLAMQLLECDEECASVNGHCVFGHCRCTEHSFANCTEDRLAIPRDAPWTCSATSYASSDGCHCGCGLQDPDCDKDFETTEVYGCENTNFTNPGCSAGVCVERVQRSYEAAATAAPAFAAVIGAILAVVAML